MSMRPSLRTAAVAALLAAAAALPATAKATVPPSGIGPVHVALIEPAGEHWLDETFAQSFVQQIATGPYLRAAESLGTGPGTFDGTYPGPAFDEHGSHVNNYDVADYVQAMVAAGTAPPNEPGRIYLLLLPDSPHRCGTTGCAWHQDTDGLNVAVIPPSPSPAPVLPVATYKLTHELVEAATDPMVAVSPEVADSCQPGSYGNGPNTADDRDGVRYALYQVDGVCTDGYRE